jgi:short-subunit dehydrogenase
MTDSTSPRPFAVVTGASSGIGRELANQFAQHGYDLLVTAEQPEITAVADDIRQRFAGEAIPVRADLSDYDGVEQLWGAINATGRTVDVVCLNAGRGAGGDFATGTRLEDELEVVDVNVRSTVHLAKRILPDMVARGRGKVLFTSSIAATMPGTYQAVYNASKSFVQSFAEAVRAELKDTGVTVTSLMPGPTDTRFFEEADMLDTKVGAGSKDDPALVAKQGYEALMKGEEKVVAGSMSNKIQAATAAILPDRAKAEMHRRMAEPGSAPQ